MFPPTTLRVPISKSSANAVLVVDDEPMVREALALQLAAEGFDVLEAGSGAEAVTVFFRHQASIVALVLDLVMPASRGEVALGIIRGVVPELPVIVATASRPQMDVRDRPRGEAEVKVLMKPFEGQVIVRELRRLIAARHQQLPQAVRVTR
jgi:CheY-like chemotaxis protein